MIDLATAPGALTIDDFGLRIGNSDQPGSWTDAPLPAGFLVRPGAGTARSDRVMIVWNDGAIRDQWLEVTVRATAATGLAQPDVFYFGSLVGETGDALEPIVVSSIDHIGVHRLARSIGPSTGYFEAFDLNRDGQVDAQDVAAVPPVTNRGLAPVFGIEPGAVDPVFELGDANLDGRFDIDDLMLALQLGEFEDLFAGNSTWSAGDWDGDGDFTTRDLVFAFQQGGFAG
jgi:hypothetical protein